MSDPSGLVAEAGHCKQDAEPLAFEKVSTTQGSHVEEADAEAYWPGMHP